MENRRKSYRNTGDSIGVETVTTVTAESRLRVRIERERDLKLYHDK